MAPMVAAGCPSTCDSRPGSHQEMLNALYDKVLPQLMLRCREREEMVKMEAFSAFKDLMRQSQGRSASAGGRRSAGGAHTRDKATRIRAACIAPRLYRDCTGIVGMRPASRYNW